MYDGMAAREAITEARFSLRAATKMEDGRRALEGDIESAFYLLGDALHQLDGDRAEAQRAVDEALEMLRSAESKRIAESQDALNAAIQALTGIAWS